MQAILTKEAPEAVGPYSQAVRVGDWLYLSGQIALDPTTGTIVAGGVVEQTHQVMKNIGAVLRAAGGDYGDLVKTTLYLVDLGHFAEVNAVYASYLRPPYPARATLGVMALPRGGLVEIEAVATGLNYCGGLMVWSAPFPNGLKWAKMGFCQPSNGERSEP